MTVTILVKRKLLFIPFRQPNGLLFTVLRQMVAGGINWQEGHADETLRVFRSTVLLLRCGLELAIFFFLCNAHLTRHGGIPCSLVLLNVSLTSTSFATFSLTVGLQY